jgi:hypothetical protein
MQPIEEEKEEGNNKIKELSKSNKKFSQRSLMSVNSQRIISKKNQKEYLNDELAMKIKTLDQSEVRKDLIFIIPFDVKKYMLYSLVVNIKSIKNKYYSNDFINGIQLKIKFKQVKVSNMFSNFYMELVDYLNRFFKWNTEFNLFIEHFNIIKQLFDLLSMDIKKIFYDFFLKNSNYLFNKKSFFLLIYLLNELKQFRWCFTQIVDQLLDYATCKGNYFLHLT